ncbi:hemicentin-1, partial [Asbolus verrucosus]
MRLGAAPPVGGSADPANDHDKGFYENLPFHGMQNPPNKSFHGFQNNQQMQLTNVPARFNFNRNLSNPYLNSVLPQTIRVPGRREADVRRTASGINISENEKPKDETNSEKIASPMASNNDKRFGSLELKKHKCYSPTFYSMRCKKHAKKRPVVYALPKKVFGDLKPPEEKKPDVYQDLTDSIQIFEQNADNEPPKAVPVPAPRCKKHRKNEIIYQNVSQQLQQDLAPNPDVSNSSNDGSENLESEISVIEAQVHTQDDRDESKPEIPRSPPKLVGVSPKANVSIDSNIIKVEAMKALKSSPMLKVSPNFIKPKTESPKGALSLQIQAKMKNSNDNLNQTDDSSKENLPLIPQMPLLNPQNKWSPGLAKANQQIYELELCMSAQPRILIVFNGFQNAFYTLTTPHYKHMSVGLPPQYSATIPHQKHTKLIPRALFNEQLPKSKSFSSKPKHKKHFQIPLQKCHSFKFQTAESYFQPIKNIHEEDLMKNGYVSDYPESSRGRHHKREKPKQKTKGPLVLRRPNEYHENVQFPENVQNSVQLQYPQPVLGRSMKKPNGVVYADLDMPKTNSKKGSHETSSSQSKSQKSKPKTEYATLSFNDIGQEIDV